MDDRLSTDSSATANVRPMPLSMVIGTTCDINPNVAVDTRKIAALNIQN